MRLLGSTDSEPTLVRKGGAAAPFVIICDHAGRAIPRSLGSLGLSEDQLTTHIAWDAGAVGVALRLGAALGACTVWQRYSRLVIDCNRPLDAADSIARRSERTVIPGNQDVGRCGFHQAKRQWHIDRWRALWNARSFPKLLGVSMAAGNRCRPWCRMGLCAELDCKA